MIQLTFRKPFSNYSKILIVTIIALAVVFNSSAQVITTLDFVKIIDEKEAEARYFYTHNWGAFRVQAKTSDWIADYQLLEMDHPEWDLLLITSYTDSVQFKAVEEKFALWREQNPTKLLNDFKPNDFRINVEAISARASILPSNHIFVSGDKCSTTNHRAFDFWIGHWSVSNPAGKYAGQNNILPLQDGCVLCEQWTSADGLYKGTSYNFYDSTNGNWHQSWIDNQGGILQLSGGLKGSNMVLESKEVINIDGQPQKDRITWIPNGNGTLDQIWERTTDQGKSWKKVFHGIYSRQN